MKTLKNIYITVGCILIVLNLLVDIAEFGRIKSPSENSAYSVGYFIGSHILLFFGLILLRMAYKIQEKIKKKQEQEIIDSIGNS